MNNRAIELQLPRGGRIRCATLIACAALLMSVSVLHAMPPPVLSIDFEKDAVIPGPGKQGTQDALKVSAGAIPIQYEPGSREDRLAEIVADPTKDGNRVLRTWLKHARAPTGRTGLQKGRIQLNLNAVNKTSVFERHRMYLPPDIGHYRSYPNESTWFGISEMWFGEASGPNRFMISLDIVKEAGAGNPLHFMVAGEKRLGGRLNQGQWQFVWSEVNRKFEIPVGVWMDVEMGYRQGDAKSGRFYMSVRPATDAEPTIIFDIINWTYHPDAPQPVPMTKWNPVKLYTSSRIVDHIRNHGGLTQIYWDDLQIWDNWSR